MPTLFLVEDNVADVELFRMALDAAGIQCELVLFEDGRQIIDHVLNNDSASPAAQPDLVILDLNLPKNDGHEVLHVLAKSPSFANVPVVILSSSSSSRERSKLANFQIREFVVKPSNIDEYLGIGTIIANLLTEIRSQRDSATTPNVG